MLETIKWTDRLGRAQTHWSSAWWAIASRFFLHGLITATWVSRIPALQTLLGLTNAQLGFCLLGTALGSVLAIPATGWLVTRYGSRPVTAWSTLGFSLSLLVPSWAAHAEALFLALVLFGAMAGSNDVAINAQGVALEKATASPSMSRFHALFSIGGMIGASIGSLIAARNIPPAWHLGIASLLWAAISLVTAPWLFEAQDERRPSAGSSRLRLSQIPPVLWTLAALGFCLFLSEGAMADWTGVYLKQNLGASAGLAAAGYAVFSTGMAVFRLAGDALASRLGPVVVVRTGAVVAAAGLICTLLAHSPLAALPGLALTGAGFSVIVPLVFGAGGRVPSVASGAGIATVSGLGYIGFLFGPPLIGLLAQATTLRLALLLLVALSLLAAVLAKAVGPTGREETALSTGQGGAAGLADHEFAVQQNLSRR